MELEITGLPAPQGSKTAYLNKATGRPVIVEGKGPGRLAVAAWREAVGETCRAYLEQHRVPPLVGPLAITIRFRFPPTKSDPYRFWHSTKPDLDKLVRSTFDALKLGGVIADDSMICKLTTLKRYINGSETAGASITIESLATEESQHRERRKERAAAARRTPADPMQEQLLA